MLIFIEYYFLVLILRVRPVLTSTSLVRIVTIGAESNMSAECYMILLAVIQLEDICCLYFSDN
jgi:hypothetical protein